MKRGLSILLHGDAGTGKSWLADSAPKPQLILDAEGRAVYLPSEPKIFWDPLKEAPPRHDGTWETCIVQVTNFEILQTTYQWLQMGEHDFVSVGLDSLMETQKRLIDSIVGQEQLQTQDWGVVLRRLEALVRQYRDLVIKPNNPVRCVVFTVGTRIDDHGVRRPLLQGQLRDSLPYYIDSVGYLYVTHEDGVNLTRNLLVQPTPSIVAKDGTNRLGGPVVVNPNLTQLFEQLQPTQPELTVATS